MKLSVMKEDLEDTQESPDTIRILNDYDALELFKKTLSAPAFTQIHKLSNEIVNSAVTTLKSAGVKDHRLDLVSLALKDRKFSYDKSSKWLTTWLSSLEKSYPFVHPSTESTSSYTRGIQR